MNKKNEFNENLKIAFVASGGKNPMLVPPVASSGGRHVGDSVTSRGLPTSAGTAALWPLTPAQPIQPPNQQPQSTPPLAATPAPAYNQGTNSCREHDVHQGTTISGRLFFSLSFFLPQPIKALKKE